MLPIQKVMNRIFELVSSARSRPGFEIRFGLLLAVVLLVTFVAYWPGLTGPFVLDDFANLSALGENGGVHSSASFLQFVFGNVSGPTGRPVSMLSFLIDAQDWPPHIAALKYTNILIHLLTATVLCWMSYCIFLALRLDHNRASALALLVTAIWLVHPLNSTTTMYVVQRMTQLMTLFALAAIICYVKGRMIFDTNTRQGVVLLVLALFPFGLLSVLSKENGAMLLLLIAVIELSVFQHKVRPHLVVWWYRLGVLLPLLVIAAYLLLTMPGSLEGYTYRHFTLGERLLTETRVLSSYLAKTFLPTTLGAGLYHDDIAISTSLFQPLTTLLSTAFLAALAVAALYWRKSQPMLFFGVGWFFGMQFLESSYLPLELYFEHRNYMSMIGPLIMAVWYLHLLLESERTQAVKTLAKSGVGIVLLFMTGLLWQNATLWGNTGDLHAYWAFEKPQSIRAQIIYADFLTENGNPQAAVDVLTDIQALYPNEITLMLHVYNTACGNGMTSPISLEDIASKENLEFKYNDLNFHLRNLLENAFANTCELESIDSLINVFNAAGTVPMSDGRRAGYHFLFADLYIGLRQLDPALVQLGRAYQLSPIPQIPYRQAILSASAENYEDSLVFLARAREADAQQSMFMPSMIAEIDRMEADIRARLAAGN